MRLTRGCRCSPRARASMPAACAPPPPRQTPQDTEEAVSGGATDLDDMRRGKACVIKTTTRQVRYTWLA